MNHVILQKGKFMSSIGFESFLLTTLCVGMTPFITTFDVIMEAALLGPFRIISCLYLTSFHKIVKEEALKTKKSN